MVLWPVVSSRSKRQDGEIIKNLADPEDFSRFEGKLQKHLRLSVKSTWRNPGAKYLIKPIEIEDFWTQNRKRDPK